MNPGRLPDPIEWHQARAVAAAAASVLGAETVALDRAIGRVLATDLLAKTEVPHYASSAMDGWAVSGDGPWRLVDRPALGAGFASVIVTGGVIPAGTDAVLRSESGFARDGQLESISATGEPHPGQHIRSAGQEAHSGDFVVRASTRLNPAHIALAAGCGHDEIAVIRRPRVSLLFTGDEVDESGIPVVGRVRDSFGPQLPTVLRMLGAEVTATRRIHDDLATTLEALTDSPGSAELIVTTGGTGDSAADHLRAALESLGAEYLVPRVAMRPGGPTMLARLPDGRVLLALPGNSLAAMIGLFTLAAPLVAAFQGRTSDVGLVKSAAALEGRRGSSILVPFRLEEGRAVANPWLGSGMMRGLADAAGVLVVPPAGVAAGEVVETLTLPWA
ncbi:molybdopterin molybdotransferase MoeA [Lacisediminihabitans sp. FW035]